MRAILDDAMKLEQSKLDAMRDELPGLRAELATLRDVLGGDVRAVFDRLARGIKAVGDSVRAESGREFMLDAKYGYIHSCPTNLGTGMRASVHVDLPGWTKEGLTTLQARCEELHLQPRGTRGESGGQTGKFFKRISYLCQHFRAFFTCSYIFLTPFLLRRCDLRHLQQAQAGLLRGAAGPEDD